MKHIHDSKQPGTNINNRSLFYHFINHNLIYLSHHSDQNEGGLCFWDGSFHLSTLVAVYYEVLINHIKYLFDWYYL